MKPIALLFIGAVSLSPLKVHAEPLATTFLGTWTCTPRLGGESFQWRVTNDLQGDWLTGEGIEQGRKTSLDVWAFSPDGQLHTRRQFSPKGALIELDVASRSDNRLQLEGTVRQRDGRSIAVRETIVFVVPQRFDAVWEARDGEAWSIVVDETCQKP